MAGRAGKIQKMHSIPSVLNICDEQARPRGHPQRNSMKKNKKECYGISLISLSLSCVADALQPHALTTKSDQGAATARPSGQVPAPGARAPTAPPRQPQPPAARSCSGRVVRYAVALGRGDKVLLTSLRSRHDSPHLVHHTTQLASPRPIAPEHPQRHLANPSHQQREAVVVG